MASQTSPSFVGKVWTKGELDKRSKNNGNQSLYRTNGEKLLTYFEIFSLELCLSLHFRCFSLPASQSNRKSAVKLSDGRNRNPR